ncbi:hypothetical protein [Janthinobacterium sp. SUN033]|uniref:RCC1 domain-containing protein n=2 Tax=unclassified Janthinobacterium TaxID=2610881 RepID=UPI0025B16C6F|nr:hypothetical protein [Janthinobacterium sp. SUN033]MDN2678621.1 hypothetical protein [Janthinobacterium sp. SUN033]
MTHLRIISATSLMLALSACGGGSTSPTSPPAPPPTPPTLPTPLPPEVSAVSPAKANIGMVTTFTVTGSNLPDNMQFALTDCAGIAELSGGSSTQRQFSCTPTGQSGARQGAVSASAGAASPLHKLSVDYQAIAAFVTSLNWRYAALKSDGTLWGWNPLQPVPVKIGDGYADVAVSIAATLAIKKDGSLWSWGNSNDAGIQGNGTSGSNATPVQIGSDFVKVVVKGERSVAGENAEALKKDGSLWVWGARSLQQPNAIEPELTPRMIDTGYVDIARGSGGASLGLKRDGSVWTWTQNLANQPFTPVKIADGYVAIATSYDAVYGLKADHSLWNWGGNAPNQAPAATPTAATPVKVGDGFVSISAGTYYALAVKSDGTLWAGGDGNNGQFGDGQFNRGAFRQVGTGIAAAWAGSACSFIQKTDGSLWAAGFCDLGDGKYARYMLTPEPVTL